MKKIAPEIITIGIIAILALCYPLVSNGLQYAPPLLFSALRVLLAGISIFLVLPLFHQPIFPPRDTWIWVILFSIPAVIFTYGIMFLSHEGKSSMLVPVLENLQPFLAVLLAAIFLHEKLSSATRIVLVSGTFGIIFMSIQMFTDSSAFNSQSALFAFLASLSAAVVSILAKRIKRPDIIVTISAWQFIIGGIPLLLLSQFFEKNRGQPWDISFLGILLFLAIIGTAVTTVAWYMLIQKVDVSRLSVLFFLSPAFGLLVASGFYVAPVTVFEWIGIAAILGGVILGLRKQSVSLSVQKGNQKVH